MSRSADGKSSRLGAVAFLFSAALIFVWQFMPTGPAARAPSQGDPPASVGPEQEIDSPAPDASTPRPNEGSGSDGPADPPLLSVIARGAGGRRSSLVVELWIELSEAGRATGWRPFLCAIPVQEYAPFLVSLPGPGEYRLRATLHGSAGSEMHSAPVSVTVAEDDRTASVLQRLVTRILSSPADATGTDLFVLGELRDLRAADALWSVIRALPPGDTRRSRAATDLAKLRHVDSFLPMVDLFRDPDEMLVSFASTQLQRAFGTGLYVSDPGSHPKLFDASIEDLKRWYRENELRIRHELRQPKRLH